MSAARPRELVLASAGSGKTFLISSRIISLLARGVAPSTLLASTFTRKAAGEILSRVLGRLAEGAWDFEAAEELGRTTGVAGADRDLWRAVLARTMQAIHELDVGTLDAFFGRAVRSFAHDLGIPAGWTVADEATADRIRARALESVLDSLGRDPMVELVRGMRGGDVRRSVHEGLSRDVDQVLEVHRDLSGKGPGWDALGEVLRGLGVRPSAGGSTGGEEAADEEARRVLAEELAARDLPKTKAGTPRTHWATARDRICEALRNGDWEDLVAETLMARVREGEGAVYDRAPLEGPVLDTLRRIADAATRALLAEYHRRARALGRLGAAYDEALDRTLREAGVLRFEDVTRLLAGEHRLAERPELGYRMDGGTKHLLLDEFQDTSLMQWRALRPLADALMGPDAPADGSASVVADPKQSIYGWRGAAPVVVETLEGPGYDLVPDTLATSFRSSRVVLDAVNTVFGGIAASEVFADSDVDRETAALWARHFHPHTPDERRRGGDFAGRVTLSAGPPMEGTGSDQPEFMRYVAERIERLHRSAPDRSLGVLVRRNETVARLIMELRDRGVPASEEGGTRLVDSPAVVSVLALLRMADHPGNTLARYHVAGTPVGAAVGFDDFTDRGAAARTAARVRRRLVHGGYGPFLASLREVLLPHCDDRDALRLGQLVELGYRQDDRPTLRADDFVQVVLKARVESGAGNPVRVMTVWGSKGLEFDTVVLPELFQTLVGGSRGGAPPLGYRPDGTGGVTHAFAPMKKEVRTLLETLSEELAGAYRQHRAGQVRDALSGLYVAMTRARHALHMIIPAEPDKPGGGVTPARLLRGALCNRIAPSDPTRQGDRIHEDGPEDWMASAPPPRDAAVAPAGGTEGAGTGMPAPIRLRDAPRRRMLPRRRPSDHEPRRREDRTAEDPSPVEVLPEPRTGGAEVDLARLLGLEGWDREGVPATVRGSVVHAWMEAVEWLEDGLPGEDERARLARREAPELSEPALSTLLEETWAWLVERLSAPAIREVLTLEGTVRALADAHPGARMVVERELPFYRREGDALVEGIIDRLVLVRESDRVVAAHVLDYKTDAVLPSDEVRLRERTELYAPQLRAYRAAVAASYRIPPGAVRLTLLFLEAGKAVEVD